MRKQSADININNSKNKSYIKSMRHTMDMFLALSDQFDPILVIEPESGEYDWYMSMSNDVAENTSMTEHGTNLYQNIGIDGASIIHPDDRSQFQAFYTPENIKKIAETGEPQEIENRWFIQTDNKYR